MKQKAFQLINKGMNRDLSISKVGDSCVYENKNIRITVSDNDTFLSVTNERGNIDVSLSDYIRGSLIGWNVINNHIIIFTHDSPSTDRIYRIDYTDGEFKMMKGDSVSSSPIFQGDLNFSLDHPIESVVYSESDKANKVYWVDGLNKLRFINLTATADEINSKWYISSGGVLVPDNTAFDTSRAINFGINAAVERKNTGNARPNGVAQYLVTYFNKFGQESGYVWISDIVYLSPEGTGGSQDNVNHCSVNITLSNVDTRYDHLRVYSIFKSSLDGQSVAYIIGDYKISGASGNITVIDDYAHQETVDVTKLLYIGSVPVKASTLAHKDQTLFIGGLESVGRSSYPEIQTAIDNNAFGQVYREEEHIWESYIVEFVYSSDLTPNIHDVAYSENLGMYPYENQLSLTSSEILTFKAGEKYRFALKFQDENGIETDAYWIGDVINHKYPYIDHTTNKIKRVVARCVLPDAIRSAAVSCGMKTVRLMIAEVTDADRSVKAQGYVNPTVFNTWERNQKRIYAMPSWVTRPRRSGISYKHFEPIKNANTTKGEIQCNYWKLSQGKSPTPYYTYSYPSSVPSAPQYNEGYDGKPTYNFVNIAFQVYHTTSEVVNEKYEVTVYMLEALASSVENIPTDAIHFSDINKWDVDSNGKKYKTYTNCTLYFSSYTRVTSHFYTDIAQDTAYERLKDYMNNTLRLPDFLISSPAFHKLCAQADSNGTRAINSIDTTTYYSDGDTALNSAPNGKWRSVGDNTGASINGNNTPSFFNKHLMFVDENVVTLDSPEISFGYTASLADDCKFRIVGISKLCSIYSDYTIDATPGIASGDNVNLFSVSSKIPSGNMTDGIISFPLWRDRSLDLKDGVTKDIDQRNEDDYEVGSGIVHYMMYMWNHSGSITSFDKDNDGSAVLNEKTFANMKVCYDTIYLSTPIEMYDIRGAYIVNKNDASHTTIPGLLDENRYYSGVINQVLSLPGSWSYPLLYNENRPSESDADIKIDDSNAFLTSTSPVELNYTTDSHAVISLKEVLNSSTLEFQQNLLPVFSQNEQVSVPVADTSSSTQKSGAILPWLSFDEIVSSVKNIIVWSRDNVAWGDAYFYDSSMSDENHLTFTSGYIQSDDWRYVSFYPNIKAALGNFDHTETVYAPIITLNNGDNKKYVNLVQIDSIQVERATSGIVVKVVDGKLLYREEYTTESPYTQNKCNVYVIEDADTSSPSSYYTGICSVTPKTNNIIALSKRFPDYSLTNNIIRTFSPNNANAGNLYESDQYLLIGEIYKEFGEDEYDTRYGGISLSAVHNNRFIPAGPAYVLSQTQGTQTFYGNRGDTYFQRWDSMRVRKGSNPENNVLDGVSLMLETHINIDGCTERKKNYSRLASVDASSFDKINPVYTQQDNFIVRRDNDEEALSDRYPSTVTWTMQKSDMSDIDEWTHITLANSITLDADKGSCVALRRMQNSIIAFQDRGISEVLFNSRTQLSTQDGVPVEIGNSGKVDGIRYITNKYGCTNKWSIVEGKLGLYFVDSINKSFCSFDGENINNLSSRLGFDLWFKSNNSTAQWTPNNFDSINSYYDKLRSDIYLVKSDTDDYPCLVYNETLGVFTSFYDYGSIPMMTNVEDKFISFKNNRIWLQNEGLFCTFYGVAKPFWIQYRVSPDPYTDKVWTNIEYRADFRRILDVDHGIPVLASPSKTEYGVTEDTTYQYVSDETFDYFRFWNEYQTTYPESAYHTFNPIKKFRIWHMPIPRAMTGNDNSTYGLDRIRNPWVNILLKKGTYLTDQTKDIMELHDVVVYYYE